VLEQPPQLVALHDPQHDMPEAGREIFFFTLPPPHFGHSGGFWAEIGMSRSNSSPQSLHWYS
jgi:hypothetical protein